MRRQPARIIIRPPQAADEALFLAAVRRSKGLHGAWVKPPSSPQKFRGYLAKLAESVHCGFVVVECQTANVRSIALVRRCGFLREGLARRYLKIGGRWQDHEHWVLLREEFNLSRRAR